MQAVVHRAILHVPIFNGLIQTQHESNQGQCDLVLTDAGSTRLVCIFILVTNGVLQSFVFFTMIALIVGCRDYVLPTKVTTEGEKPASAEIISPGERMLRHTCMMHPRRFKGALC